MRDGHSAQRALAAFGLAVVWAIAGCRHRPTIAYPKPVEAGPTEAAFDCPRLDDAILKADAVRWVMRQDGARLLSPAEQDGRVAGTVALYTVSMLGCFLCPPVDLGDEGHSFVDRADRRLLSLLKLKSEKGCPPRSTSIPGMSDLQVYDAASALVAEEARKDPGSDVGQLREDRTRLLDGLRAQAASP